MRIGACLWAGMAIQAAIVGILIALDVVTISAGQQFLASLVFVIGALIFWRRSV